MSKGSLFRVHEEKDNVYPPARYIAARFAYYISVTAAQKTDSRRHILA